MDDYIIIYEPFTELRCIRLDSEAKRIFHEYNQVRRPKFDRVIETYFKAMRNAVSENGGAVFYSKQHDQFIFNNMCKNYYWTKSYTVHFAIKEFFSVLKSATINWAIEHGTTVDQLADEYEATHPKKDD